MARDSLKLGVVQFSIFDSVPDFHHALSTREGGVSKGECSSLNLGFHVGDEVEAVRENRRRFANSAGFTLDRLVAAQQVHGASNCLVSSKDAGKGSVDWDNALTACDALITRETNLPLLILVADCAPILLVDPSQRVLAVVHAGWRGALAGVASHALQTMQNAFGTSPEDVLAAIGPCLSVANLEVGEEVALEVTSKNPRAVLRDGGIKPHLDLRALIRDDLTNAGVQVEHIETSTLCPRDYNDTFFSHRGQNGKAGRFGLVGWWS